ncbi:MAG: hypothetical protein EOP10_31225 [Proteobacteria bacterium]|nr:MAG: hypothetical protein EOP10_31225 [Pseudomonadota bacterium]
MNAEPETYGAAHGFSAFSIATLVTLSQAFISKNIHPRRFQHSDLAHAAKVEIFDQLVGAERRAAERYARITQLPEHIWEEASEEDQEDDEADDFYSDDEADLIAEREAA